MVLGVGTTAVGYINIKGYRGLIEPLLSAIESPFIVSIIYIIITRISKVRVLNYLVNSSIIDTAGTEAITVGLSLATTPIEGRRA